MMNLLSGKVVVVTGASSGIGKQCAISCSENGAKCILIGRDKKRLQNTCDLLVGDGHLQFIADVNDGIEMERIIAISVEQLGRIYGFIHAAGIEITKPFRMHSLDDYESQIRTNALSALNIIRILSKKRNCSSDGASFVAISSVMGSLGQPGQVGYCASKSLLTSAIKAVSLELAPKLIRVNSVSPGFVFDTKMGQKFLSDIPEENRVDLQKRHALGWVKTIDVANGCLFLLSDLSMRITGTNLLIDSGYSAK